MPDQVKKKKEEIIRLKILIEDQERELAAHPSPCLQHELYNSRILLKKREIELGQGNQTKTV